MTIDMVLNELSLQSPASDASIARQWMSDFIQTVRAVKAQAGQQAVLRTQYSFRAALLSPDYPVGQWLRDSAVDLEERRFIKTLVTKAPFSEDTLNAEVQEIESNSGSCEFLHQGEVAIGLGVAYILDIIPISLRSKLCWDCSYLDLEIIHIDQDNEEVKIIHASLKNHIQDHIEWFQARLKKAREIFDGEGFWNKREELFPNLQFCDSVKDQLLSLRTGDVMLNPIEKRLSDLQMYAENWLNGAFDSGKIACKATPESEATLKQYAQERTFTCPDGQNRTFSWHVRLTPLAWRIYFYPNQAGQIIIGYIGSHLPTNKFK